MHEKSDTKFCNSPNFPVLSIEMIVTKTYILRKPNVFIVKKSLKWGTVGFFRVSESKVIVKSKKRLKKEFAQFL